MKYQLVSGVIAIGGVGGFILGLVDDIYMLNALIVAYFVWMRYEWIKRGTGVDPDYLREKRQPGVSYIPDRTINNQEDRP